MIKKLFSFAIVLIGLLQWQTLYAKPVVGVLVYADSELIDFAGPIEVFGVADYKVITFSYSGDKIRAWPGITIEPDHSLEDLPTIDILVVPGGQSSVIVKNKKIIDWIKNQSDKVSHIISVCTGANILAETGILDGKSATTFMPILKKFAERFPKINVLNNTRYVDNGKIITSGGLSSGIDASLHLVAKISGVDKAKEVAQYLEYNFKENSGITIKHQANQTRLMR